MFSKRILPYVGRAVRSSLSLEPGAVSFGTLYSELQVRFGPRVPFGAQCTEGTLRGSVLCRGYTSGLVGVLSVHFGLWYISGLVRTPKVHFVTWLRAEGTFRGADARGCTPAGCTPRARGRRQPQVQLPRYNPASEPLRCTLILH